MNITIVMFIFFKPYTLLTNDLKYYEITQQIIGASMKIHRHFGPGFPEIVYQKALMIELNKIPLSYGCEIEKEIFYEGKLIYKRRLDLLVENKILIELKATTEIDNNHWNQILNYLRVFNIEVGLIINFGAKSLLFKRFINSNIK